MRGYIREYRPGKWSYTFYVGKNEQGKPKKIEKGGFTSKKECESVLSKKLVELDETGTVFKPSDKTFAEVFKEFADKMKYEWTPGTLRIKQDIYNLHLDKALGFRYIKTIKTLDIDDLLKTKLDEGLSGSYVTTMRKVINGTMNYAVKYGYIRQNPCLNAITPKVIPKQIEIFSTDEIKQILDIYKNHDLLVFLMLGIYTGMRCGEIIGLRWSDIDFTARTIDVQRQIVNNNDDDVISECKHGSNRLIHIPQQLVDYLVQLKAQQEHNAEMACEHYQKYNIIFNTITNKKERIADFVCIRKTGKRFYKRSPGTIIAKCKQYGIKFHPHKLRHTYATTLLEAGCSIKMLQETLGHSSATFTLDIYSHVSKKHEESIVDKLPTY